MTIRASPDQIFFSTATNSTCRVATTLLGIHGRSPHNSGGSQQPFRGGVSGGLGGPAIEQGPAADADPGAADGGRRRPLVEAEPVAALGLPGGVGGPAP